MLKLDSLEILGFKSFAEKTRIDFTDRITAIVGPNGCGKSNLSDALGWVLGAHSARNIRGQNMDDVLFNGTGKRRPSGVVEARLTMRRQGGEPIRFEGEELQGDSLVISRKYYRSGESQYAVNQRRCRLMDIQKLLQDTGLGFASYAMIAQGQIESFLVAKPLDRRAVIEEAAEIIGYKSKRRSAELRLEMAQQNLLRISDIIAEAGRQLRSLKRQAAKARRYRKLKGEYRALLRQRFALDSERLQSQLREAAQKLEAHSSREAELQADFEEKEAAFRIAAKAREDLEQELQELRRQEAAAHLQLDRAKNAIQFNRQQIDSTQKSLQGNLEDQRALSEATSQCAEEMARFKQELALLQQEKSLQEAAVQSQRELADRRRQELREAESRLESLRGALLKSSSDAVSLKNQKDHLAQRLADLFHARQRLEEEKAAQTERLKQAQEEWRKKQRELNSRQRQVEALQQENAELSREKGGLETELERLKAEGVEIQNQSIALKERLQSLQEVELNRAHYSESVQKVLNHFQKSRSLKTGGALADAIDTSPEFERLVEEFLDEELEYVLVDSLDDALRGLSELRNLKSGKCTFMSMRSSNGFGKTNGRPAPLKPDPKEGLYGSLAGILRMKPEVQEAFHRVLPHHAEAVVVSDIDRAMSLAHSYPERTFITLAGEAMTPKGLLSAAASDSRKLGLLSLKRKKMELEKQIESIVKSQRRQEKRQADCMRRLAAVSDQRRLGVDRFVTLEKECINWGHACVREEAEMERCKRTLQTHREELEGLEAENKIRQDKLKGIEELLSAAEKQKTETEKLLAQSAGNLLQLRSEAESVQRELNSISADLKVIEERNIALHKTIERVSEQREGLLSRRAAAQKMETENRRRLEELQQTVRRLETEVAELEKQRELLQGALLKKEEEFHRERDGSRALEAELESLREKRNAVLQQRSQVEVEAARLETQWIHIGQQCADLLGAPLEEAVQGVDLSALNEEEIRSRHDVLKRRLEKFGPINMTALQEYQENEQRHKFLTSQKQDVEQSIADTTKAIQEMNRRSREKFQEAFRSINENFQKVFAKLFGGGECGMELMDEEDVLECGIDVYAQPPGKKLQNVMLLSGGEKAMTVFALLVALFMFRPSRFCILDEVDAPLDDSNVRRFGALIRELSEQTQFVVVTHNKRTMEIADALYGVTMEEPGVSQVVSVQFADQVA